jgi:hypothetical protein
MRPEALGILRMSNWMMQDPCSRKRGAKWKGNRPNTACRNAGGAASALGNAELQTMLSLRWGKIFRRTETRFRLRPFPRPFRCLRLAYLTRA